MKQLRFFKITFLTFMIFVLETIFFHVLNYVYDYFNAVLIISYVIMGIGLGAFLSSRITLKEETLFPLCCLGMMVFLCVSLSKITVFSSPGVSNAVLSLAFVFPALYIARMYSEENSHQIYLFDMLGAFLGVVLIVLAYEFFTSESLILIALTLLPLVALIFLLCQKPSRHKTLIAAVLICLGAGSAGLTLHGMKPRFNLYDLIDCEGVDPRKTFCKYPGRLVKSYDNLVGRIDVTATPRFSSYKVSYDGYSNDHLDPKLYAREGEEWPIHDVRILYGVTEEPKVLVIGSSAQGIIKPLKSMTDPSYIDAIEINPAILTIMQEDFFEESGRAYEGLNPRIGNGLSYLHSTSKKYDIITAINVHSVRNLPYEGAPDTVHTTESYDLLLDHLTEEGYILFEERPQKNKGKLSLYREFITLYHTLKERGAENPLDHFVVWSWNWNGPATQKYQGMYYVSFIVTKNPIKGAMRSSVLAWINFQLKRPRPRFHFEFLNDHYASPEFEEFSRMLASNDFSALEAEDFDSSITSNDRPFLSQSTLKTPRLHHLVKSIGVICLVLWILFTTPLMKSKNRKTGAVLNLYYLLIGFAFFFIETILLQVYQNVFLSPSSAFIFVLGFLLLSSGVGGYYSKHLQLKHTIIFLIPLSLLAIFLPGQLFSWGVPHQLVKALGIVAILFTGFTMGVYFPKGLSLAKTHGLKREVYHLFAINALAGSFAVVMALYLGVKIGYSMTLAIGLVCYLTASILISLYDRPRAKLA